MVVTVVLVMVVILVVGMLIATSYYEEGVRCWRRLLEERAVDAGKGKEAGMWNVVMGKGGSRRSGVRREEAGH
ncbi:hypothetical protein E2C01_064885 [Portunus trituberculatus]|uniref:Uncharacterized protein n=1 Tax=Portunus trituberculatus TaxID=210409 RepID=A0A5B7HD20_PORTR|nr:hypothetical protein [Portunus trituberculatus]